MEVKGIWEVDRFKTDLLDMRIALLDMKADAFDKRT